MPGSLLHAGSAAGGEASAPAAFGRYAILAPIGGGAMGMVYKAHDPLIDRVVAVKVMRADTLEPAARAEYLERFRIEVRAAGRCTHPAIVGVHDFGEQDGTPYIVMEFVEGRTLSAMLKEAGEDRRAMAPRLATAMLQVLEGLGAAHALGIVHRDVKPSNILVTGEGRAKIADFGIARLDIASLTAVGGMVGTPAYMAPEQALGRPVDARTDLFAAAAILYEILLGRPPFAGASLPETLLRLTAPEPADLGPLAGTPLGMVLARGLEKEPTRRHASTLEFTAALRSAMAGAPVEEATVVLGAGLPGLAAAGTASAALGSGSRTAFDGTLLTRLREDLARHMGPIAETLLRRAAATAANEDELIRACGNMIETPQERAAFLRRHRATPGSGAMAASAPTLMPVASGPAAAFGVSPAAEARAAEALAFHVGPIARVLVKRALAEARSEAAFLDRLAEAVSDPAEAATFRRRLKTALDEG
ncbi:MAG TPA: serine/threonine-protein kinase [Acetobacteraceae bacterium]|nr:serine/threonine-protein kinase [Acetobacteraceae bacterium]